MKKYLPIVLPTLFLLILAPFTPWLDLSIERFFFSMGQGRFLQTPLLEFMYVWGLVPGQLLMVLSLMALIASYLFKSLKSWKRASLVLVLTSGIGAGVICHALLKDHWGRPRPKQVIEFGGEQQFRPFWSPHFSNPITSKSFPCGHCTMGFYFFAVTFLGRRYKNSFIFWSGLGLALLLGIGLGLTRMAQGGHFFSDVLFSAYILYICSWGFDELI
jgi:membrane-associated PAP2 superfamily phosphatase